MKPDKWVEYTPVCSRCGEWGKDCSPPIQGNGSGTRRETETAARVAGWTETDGMVLSPECAKQYKDASMNNCYIKIDKQLKQLSIFYKRQIKRSETLPASITNV